MYWLVPAILAGISQRIVQPFASDLQKSYALCSEASLIYTVDSSNPTTQCILVDGDTIVEVGSQERINSRLPGVQTILLNSSFAVVPGLADAHAHILEYGFNKQQVVLQGSSSVGEIVSRTKEFILSHPDILHNKSAFIAGMGWDQNQWPGSQFPTAADLESDPMLAGRPIVFRRVDAHAAWVSQAVLEMMSPLPPSVEGGHIIVDNKGHPTGVFLDNAMDLIPRPTWTYSQTLESFQITMKDGLSYGLTSIHDAFVDPDSLEFFKKAAEDDQVPMRLYLMKGIGGDGFVGTLPQKLHQYGARGRLTLRSVKIIGDGALGSWGAALLAPYSDNPSTSGFLLHSETALGNLTQHMFQHGWQVNIHCIGDRANQVVLDILEDLLQDYSVSNLRPRIEHAQIMTHDDLKRMSKLKVIPSVQPTHATSDMWYAESRLGSERTKGAYAYRTMQDASHNGMIALGSDFPVEGINPLLGFFAAVARVAPDGTSPHGSDGWYPAEALTREQALRAMTLGAAYAAFAEDDIGSLEVGKRADFVVLDRDIMTIPMNEVLGTKVIATVVDGRLAFGSLTTAYKTWGERILVTYQLMLTKAKLSFSNVG